MRNFVRRLSKQSPKSKNKCTRNITLGSNAKNKKMHYNKKPKRNARFFEFIYDLNDFITLKKFSFFFGIIELQNFQEAFSFLNDKKKVRFYKEHALNLNDRRMIINFYIS